ncbi:hypothetical protein PBY51_021937 [Eleginops maclovinus]|uniref:Intraflagellar transport protein 57 homolog n=1 Tax=Eleginops maclovinus TaxID=56733 RepID=A0AAN7XFP9_ELEMC|nr:hypothetical protein PBY51_021937 [Eleginops maclovinus]
MRLADLSIKQQTPPVSRQGADCRLNKHTPPSLPAAPRGWGLEHLIQEYRSAQAKLSQAKERYQQASGGVTERTRVLAEISEELEKVKQEMEEKGSSMSDGGEADD